MIKKEQYTEWVSSTCVRMLTRYKFIGITIYESVKTVTLEDFRHGSYFSIF